MFRVNIQKSTVGFYLSFGYDWGIYKGLGLGFQLSGLMGKLSPFPKLEEPYTYNINVRNLYRIDLSIGLRFNK